ncbi:MAG: DNA repair protein RecN [Marinilabiliales bacterium]
MIKNLLIKNYALIEKIEINFEKGFSTITGETGAGKSIILGALSLILGERFEHNMLFDKTKKCIIEGAFIVSENLKELFEANDLDFDTITVIHREITPTGKSRTFINDTPVTLNVLKEITHKLVDLHSQYHTLQLKEQSFQLELIDSYANNETILLDYQKLFNNYKRLSKTLEQLEIQVKEYKSNLDYYEFQFKQLNQANLIPDEQENLESELKELTHAEEIKSALFITHSLIESEEQSINNQIKNIISKLQNIAEFSTEADNLQKRLESVFIELKDISDEAYNLYDRLDFDQERIEKISNRLNLIYELQNKYHVSNIEDLIKIKEEFELKIQETESFDEQYLTIKKELDDVSKELEHKSVELHNSRIKIIDKLSAELISYLKQLGMPEANIVIEIQSTNDYTKSGKDNVKLLFSSNNNVKPCDISKVASGGELSRIMLAIKAIISRTKQLPTMIFDEIDMGVSGEIADKMSSIMKNISKINQVIAITHLPQIASKGDFHYKVFKYKEQDFTATGIKLLDNNERINEIAAMLSGDNITDAAIDHSKSLLGLRN